MRVGRARGGHQYASSSPTTPPPPHPTPHLAEHHTGTTSPPAITPSPGPRNQPRPYRALRPGGRGRAAESAAPPRVSRVIPKIDRTGRSGVRVPGASLCSCSWQAAPLYSPPPSARHRRTPSSCRPPARGRPPRTGAGRRSPPSPGRTRRRPAGAACAHRPQGLLAWTAGPAVVGRPVPRRRHVRTAPDIEVHRPRLTPADQDPRRARVGVAEVHRPPSTSPTPPEHHPTTRYCGPTCPARAPAHPTATRQRLRLDPPGGAAVRSGTLRRVRTGPIRKSGFIGCPP